MSSGKDLLKFPSPYQGRWVAMLQGRIIAHGGTPEQARLAALKSRYKEKPEIEYMAPTSPFFFSELTDKVRAILPNSELYLVGGALRDAFLNRLSHDFDFALPANAIETARYIASALNADFYVLDRNYDTARVIITAENGERDVLDFSAFRGVDLESDLRGRDFTINALAYDLRTQTIFDPLNGNTDLRSKIIRACSESSLQDDPVRVLRAVRQAAAFDFKIETVTRKAMKEASSELTKVSPERKRDELFKILEGPHPDKALRALEILTVYPHLLPELSAIKGVAQSAPHVKDVWEHTLSVIRYLDDILTVLAEGYNAENTHDTFTGMLTLRLGRYREQFIQHFKQHLNADRSLRSLLFFAALYHDVSKPATKSVDATGKIRFIGHQGQSAAIAVERAKSFNLSNDEIERLEIIITNHMRFKALTDQFETGKKELSRKAIFHFFRDAEEAGVDLILLGLADLRGTSEHNLTQSQWTSSLDAARELLENYWEKPEKTVNPPQLLDGNDIITIYSLEEGPLIGKLLHAIREAQATGKVVTRKEAVEFGFKWLETNR